MTRHRRNPDQVTRDRLEAKLRAQKHAAASAKDIWERAETEVEKTRQALNLLGVNPLLGFEAEPTLNRPQATPEAPSEPTAVAVVDSHPQMLDSRPQEAEHSTLLLLPPATCPWFPDGPPHLHRQVSDGINEYVQCMEDKT